jgi:hypothetical protein
MKEYQIKLPTEGVDFDSLRTDQDFRREARRLLPAVLAQLSGEAAGAAWDKWRETREGIGGMAGTPSDAERKRFMVGEPAGFRARATEEELREIEDEVVQQLREHKTNRA